MDDAKLNRSISFIPIGDRPMISTGEPAGIENSHQLRNAFPRHRPVRRRVSGISRAVYDEAGDAGECNGERAANYFRGCGNANIAGVHIRVPRHADGILNAGQLFRAGVISRYE
ncbi:MAG TPA: hypothetical protein VHI13_07625 [Candidatus Kapabacteria bacterium]|nr:hypothetical protein [Candidatus Kapabacteria bacterium]